MLLRRKLGTACLGCTNQCSHRKQELQCGLQCRWYSLFCLLWDNALAFELSVFWRVYKNVLAQCRVQIKYNFSFQGVFFITHVLSTLLGMPVHSCSYVINPSCGSSAVHQLMLTSNMRKKKKCDFRYFYLYHGMDVGCRNKHMTLRNSCLGGNTLLIGEVARLVQDAGKVIITQIITL